MAIFASGRQNITARYELAVHRLGVHLLLIAMAGAACNLRQFFLVGNVLILQVRVAVYTGKRSMH